MRKNELIKEIAKIVSDVECYTIMFKGIRDILHRECKQKSRKEHKALIHTIMDHFAPHDLGRMYVPTIGRAKLIFAISAGQNAMPLWSDSTDEVAALTKLLQVGRAVLAKNADNVQAIIECFEIATVACDYDPNSRRSSSGSSFDMCS